MLDPNSYQGIGWLMMALAALAVIVNQFLRVTDRFKERPPPSETYTTLKECKILHSAQDGRVNRLECDVAAIRTEIKAMGTELNHADEERSIALHNRLNPLEKSMGGVEVAITSLTAQVAQMNMHLGARKQ